MLLEVIVASAADADAAVRGGADRLELVSAPEQGGLTPEPRLLREVLAGVDVPVRVMLRGADRQSLGDREALRRSASDLAEAGATAFVVGGLTADGDPDPGAADVVPDGAAWTFHRALDATADLVAAVRTALAMTGCDTVLVAGSPVGVGAGLPRVRDLMTSGVDPGAVLVGGGVRRVHLPALVALGVRAVHLGRAVRAPGTWDGRVDPALVAVVREGSGAG